MMRDGEDGRTLGPAGIRGLRGRRVRLAAGVLALAALALLLSQADRLPGPAGDAIRRNAAADQDATALFYTEVNGWQRWADNPHSR